MNAVLAVLAVGAVAIAYGLISDWYYEQKEKQESKIIPMGLKTL
jgi:hypothetical protein